MCITVYTCTTGNIHAYRSTLYIGNEYVYRHAHVYGWDVRVAHTCVRVTKNRLCATHHVSCSSHALLQTPVSSVSPAWRFVPSDPIRHVDDGYVFGFFPPFRSRRWQGESVLTTGCIPVVTWSLLCSRQRSRHRPWSYQLRVPHSVSVWWGVIPWLTHVKMRSTPRRRSFFTKLKSEDTYHNGDYRNHQVSGWGLVSLLVCFESLLDNCQVTEDHLVRVDNWFNPWIKIWMTSPNILSSLSLEGNTR